MSIADLGLPRGPADLDALAAAAGSQGGGGLPPPGLPDAATLTLSDSAALVGPSRASLSGMVLDLPPNGFAWLDRAVDLLA